MKARACTIAAVLGLVLLVTSAWARERVYYFHNDHLGTPQAMSDAAGRKVWEAEYEPFGKAAVNQDHDGDGQIVINNLRFPGQYFDAETGLHYNYHRDFDPATGRYLQPDPIGLDGGLNLYSYVSNNPISLSDPTGENPAAAVLIIGGGGFVLAAGAKAYLESPAGKELVSNVCEFARTGIEKGRNWATEQAKEESKQTGRDPCDILSAWYKEARASGNSAKALAIKAAQKFMGCRGKTVK
jgi:RHS repeat-associated protein